jgi:hypothetical protein
MSKNRHKRTKKNIVERLKDNNGLLSQDIIDKQEKSDHRYKSRIKKRVEHMLSQPYTYFFTYTFNDANIHKTTEETHIKKIRATLSQATSYIINNDYGDLNDRYHYHALASFNHKYNTTFMEKWQYGYTNIKPITDPNSKALYEYLIKLTNHSIKKSVAKIWRSRSSTTNKRTQ